MNKLVYLLVAIFLMSGLFSFTEMGSPDWGFFGHRKINRMAVFTLSPDLIKFYKKNIEFVTQHAVDPDKRRYATKYEFARHYIDIDHWGKAPFDNVPKNLSQAVLKFGTFDLVNTEGDTTSYRYVAKTEDSQEARLVSETGDAILKLAIGEEVGDAYMRQFIFDQYYEDVPWEVDPSLFLEGQKNQEESPQILFTDIFSQYGILPYHLPVIYKQLVGAYETKNVERILQLSADIGHYIGDAHVPLHTTENYNGQLTDQVGIHGFWESRIPELFAEEEYDFFVGPAEYIENKSDYFWDIVFTSHALLDSVLLIEKEMSQQYPLDEQYCYDERLGRTIRTYCPDYADAYHDRMAGMVEKRMRESVLAIGSVWYSAWIDAGQPDMEVDQEYVYSDSLRQELKNQDNQFKGGAIFGRDH